MMMKHVFNEFEIFKILHQIDRKWADIGYHFLVGENGKVYEGRGWHREAAHSTGWNNEAYGISVHLLFE